jgi:hypothetical protein
VTLFLSASDRPQSGRFRDQPGERPAASGRRFPVRLARIHRRS